MTEVRTRLDELLARVEAASGPDREIDRDLWAALRAEPVCRNPQMLGNTDWPRYTASIDAAVGLVEKMLPGWRIDLTCHGSEAFAHLFDRDHGHPRCKQFNGKSSIGAMTAREMGDTSRQSLSALALCAALLRALIAQETK